MAKRKPKTDVPAVPGDTSLLPPDPDNPREISDEAAAGLSYSLTEFGDISGIVFNLRTGELVCGHQRLARIRDRYRDLPLVQEGEAPAEPRGLIRTPDGHTFNVRLVDWPRAKQRAANIAANSGSLQGEFTDELDVLLEATQEETPELYDGLLFDEFDDIRERWAHVNLGEMPELADGDRAPFQQITFTLHDSQVEVVRKAMGKAKAAGEFTGSPNENSNGNALARIAEAFCG